MGEGHDARRLQRRSSPARPRARVPRRPRDLELRGPRACRDDPPRARGRRHVHARAAGRTRHGPDRGRARTRDARVARASMGRVARGGRAGGRDHPRHVPAARLPRGDAAGEVVAQLARRRRVGLRRGEPDPRGDLRGGARLGRRRAHGGRSRARRRDVRVRPVPAAGPSRGTRDDGRVLLLQQRRDRRRGPRPALRESRRDPRRRLPPRQRDAAGLLQRGPTCCTSRSTAIPNARTRTSPGSPRRRGAVPARARTSTSRCRCGARTTSTSRRSRRGSRRSGGSSPTTWSSRSASTRTTSIRSATWRSPPRPTTRRGGGSVSSAGRPCVLQEGGYHVDHLGSNVRTWLRGLEGLDAGT